MEATLIPTLINGSSKTDSANKLNRQFETFTKHIKTILLSDKSFSLAFYESFNEIFLLRLETHAYVKTHQIGHDELNEASEKFTAHIQSISDPSDENLFFLVENTLFALQTLKRVARESIGTTILKPLENVEYHHYTSYDNFRNYLISSYKNFGEDTQNRIKNFFDASLILDACLIAVHLIIEEKLMSKLSENKIDELGEMIAGNAQTYGGCALGLGISSKRKSRSDYPMLEENELLEQMLIAESGIDEYRQIIDNE